MRRSIRLAIAAGAAFAVFAFTGSAWAAYAPKLVVLPINNNPGKATTMVLGHDQADTDDPTFKDTIYAPLGYQWNLTQPVGTKIGDVTATLILRQGGNAKVDVEGDVVADNPASHPNDPCVQGQGLHQAVWKLNITVAGTPLTVYVYVDAITAGPEATFASGKIQLCLAGPIGTPAGAQLLSAAFVINGVFTNPPNKTARLWRATFTPYTPGTPNPNPAGTTEGQALVPGKVSLSVTQRRLKRGVIVFSGRLLVDGQPFAGAKVEFFVPGKSKPVASGRTNRAGRFTVRKRFKKKTLLLAEVIVVEKVLPTCPAAPLPTVPQGCKSATTSFAAAQILRARPRR